MSEQLQTEQWLCFELGSETYAQRVIQVREILDYRLPVAVPGAHQSVEGVLNIRGEIVTIVSGQHMLDLKETDHRSQHIMVVETDKGLVGISVGEVMNITQLEPQQVMPVDTRESGSPVWGTIQHDEELLILTDFERSIKELESYE
jgi:purine-binding chemotaxis protein CheW